MRIAVTVMAALACVANAQTSAIPAQFDTRNAPVVWTADASGAITINAGRKTNWFIAPLDLRSWDSAPMLLFRPADEFALSAKITLEPKSRWDAGSLVLFVNERTWAKLCLEAPDGPGKLTVVNVVTRGESDDGYSFPIAGNSAFMKVAKIGPSFVFYASADGRSWQMVRNFRLDAIDDLRVGFSAQSPTGEGTKAAFSDIRYTPSRVSDMYKGE